MSGARVVEFRFALGEAVRVGAIGAAGHVTGRREFPGSVKEYFVLYWVDGKRTVEWLYEHELEADV